MKKIAQIIIILALIVINSAFADFDPSFFKLNNLANNTKIYKTDEVYSCNDSSVKSYMDYRMITLTTSKQYQYINNYMNVTDEGLLIDEDGFIGVALGSYYGEIGSRYYFTLDDGKVLPLIKIEAKANVDTDELGCAHNSDSSVIEFVIDYDKARSYFGTISNSYILNGNFNNYEVFRGKIKKVEKVLNEKRKQMVTFVSDNNMPVIDDSFNNLRGY